jgi:hypothetical protein
MIAQPYKLHIERRDTARNMARFYVLSIRPDFVWRNSDDAPFVAHAREASERPTMPRVGEASTAAATWSCTATRNSPPRNRFAHSWRPAPSGLAPVGDGRLQAPKNELDSSFATRQAVQFAPVTTMNSLCPSRAIWTTGLVPKNARNDYKAIVIVEPVDGQAGWHKPRQIEIKHGLPPDRKTKPN